jgi:hypothetical protein
MADIGTKVESTMERKIYKACAGTFEGTEDTSLLYFSCLHNPELSKLERIGVMSLLEDCIAQLYILGKSNKKTTVPNDMQYRSFKERYMNVKVVNSVC